jgi:prepilin-type N-terminal cleavage/methylation domain-containing protein
MRDKFRATLNPKEPVSLMKTDPFSDPEESSTGCERGWTFTELLVVLAVLAVLALTVLPATARSNTASARAVCASNLRQILTAVAMYATENRDYLPHPSWGSIGPSPGPDNWCYATRIGNQQIPSAAGRSGTNQLPFYHAGQLAPFLKTHEVFFCPTDLEDSLVGAQYKAWYKERACKLTSYTMNGAVCSFGQLAPSGITYRLGQFKPSDICFWEANETVPFNFNDAASVPSTTEGVSQRHETDVIVATFGGGTEWWSFSQWTRYSRPPMSELPNRLWCDPVASRGGYQ